MRKEKGERSLSFGKPKLEWTVKIRIEKHKS